MSSNRTPNSNNKRKHDAISNEEIPNSEENSAELSHKRSKLNNSGTPDTSPEVINYWDEEVVAVSASNVEKESSESLSTIENIDISPRDEMLTEITINPTLPGINHVTHDEVVRAETVNPAVKSTIPISQLLNPIATNTAETAITPTGNAPLKKADRWAKEAMAWCDAEKDKLSGKSNQSITLIEEAVAPLNSEKSIPANTSTVPAPQVTIPSSPGLYETLGALAIRLEAWMKPINSRPKISAARIKPILEVMFSLLTQVNKFTQAQLIESLGELYPKDTHTLPKMLATLSQKGLIHIQGRNGKYATYSLTNPFGVSQSIKFGYIPKSPENLQHNSTQTTSTTQATADNRNSSALAMVGTPLLNQSIFNRPAISVQNPPGLQIVSSPAATMPPHNLPFLLPRPPGLEVNRPVQFVIGPPSQPIAGQYLGVFSFLKFPSVMQVQQFQSLTSENTENVDFRPQGGK